MLKVFESPKKNNYFAPEWRFCFYDTAILDETKILRLKELILSKEKSIIDAYPDVQNDGGTGLGFESLTARFSKYNIFKWPEPEFQELTDYVKSSYYKFIAELGLLPEKIYAKCWANVMRKGEKIFPHWHSCFPDSYLGGHLVISALNTSTIYQNPFNPTEQYVFRNIPGNLTFFPNHLLHYTDVHEGTAERITLAFDLVTENYIMSYPIDMDNYILFD